jgi:hypothetical protein
VTRTLFSLDTSEAWARIADSLSGVLPPRAGFDSG